MEAGIINDHFSANFITLQPYPFDFPFYTNHWYLSIPVRMTISKNIARGIRPGNPFYQVSINRKLMETMIHFSLIFFYLSPISTILLENNALILEKADILPVFRCLVYRPAALNERTCSAANNSAPRLEVCYGAFELHNRPSRYLIRLFFDLPMVSKTTHWQTVKSRCLAAVQLNSAIELRRHWFLFLATKDTKEHEEEKKKSEDEKVSTIVPVLSIYLPIKTRNHYPHGALPRSREQVIYGIYRYPIELSTLVKGGFLLLFPALLLHLFLFLLAAKEREGTYSAVKRLRKEIVCPINLIHWDTCFSSREKENTLAVKSERRLPAAVYATLPPEWQPRLAPVFVFFSHEGRKRQLAIGSWQLERKRRGEETKKRRCLQWVDVDSNRWVCREEFFTPPHTWIWIHLQRKEVS